MYGWSWEWKPADANALLTELQIVKQRTEILFLKGKQISVFLLHDRTDVGTYWEIDRGQTDVGTYWEIGRR